MLTGDRCTRGKGVHRGKKQKLIRVDGNGTPEDRLWLVKYGLQKPKGGGRGTWLLGRSKLSRQARPVGQTRDHYFFEAQARCYDAPSIEEVETLGRRMLADSLPHQLLRSIGRLEVFIGSTVQLCLKAAAYHPLASHFFTERLQSFNPVATIEVLYFLDQFQYQSESARERRPGTRPYGIRLLPFHRTL